MRYDEFVKKTRECPVFGEEMLSTAQEGKGYRRLALSRWAKSGKVIRLKRGLYTLPEEARKIPFSRRWLANTLYSPSYVSLEYVLSRYDLIPERVHAVTSVTLNKTRTFRNPLGRFIYRHLKEGLFFGFEPVTDEFQTEVLMASPEKALLDSIYLSKVWEPTVGFLEENMRLQGLESLRKKRLKEFGNRFACKKMEKAVSFLLKQF